MRRSTICKQLVCLLSLALCLAQAPVSFAWGNEGHTYVNGVAAQKILLPVQGLLSFLVDVLRRPHPCLCCQIAFTARRVPARVSQ